MAVVLSTGAARADVTGSPTLREPPKGCSTTNLAKLPRLIRAAKGGEVCFVAKVYSVSDRIRLVDRRYEAGEDPSGVFLEADLAAYAGDSRNLRYGDVVRVTGRLSLNRLCWEEPLAFCAPARRPGTLTGGRIVKIASARPGEVAPWEAAP
ncbi:hypothetical protein QO010_000781 [Caulobacter ginsengisoli]|uniref:DUF5666 domain-containing protein n=1 Tax=Caulobacter ginsengisoli TaxID=400775 RepID=A0ABU0IPD0_9CAUL|nr:hypothetical protein [Caulobacter ginsengisoli]MDQ0463033.1 hypothetical protein [Caulobacter ginsengisoli]